MLETEAFRRIRQQLEEEHFRLLGKMESNAKSAGQRSGANLDHNDLANDYALGEQRFALGNVERARLIQIRSALGRIDAGYYGTCADCGVAISPERLEIIPYATRCVRCRQERDLS